MGHYMNERELYMSNASNDKKKKITEALRFFLRLEIICRVSKILRALDISYWFLLLLS